MSHLCSVSSQRAVVAPGAAIVIGGSGAGNASTDGGLRPQSVSKSMLRRARVIGQCDRKFVFGVVDGVVLAFDQHAADERVKLEALERALEREVAPSAAAASSGCRGGAAR